MDTVSYFPLPLDDREIMTDGRLRKALRASGFHMNESTFGQVVNPTTGDTLVLLGDGEAQSVLSDANWDIFRSMDTRARLVHQRRLFPCNGKFGEIFGRLVTVGHPVYEAEYELRDGFYAGFYDIEGPSAQEIIDADAAEPKEKTSAPRIVAEAVADIFGWLIH